MIPMVIVENDHFISKNPLKAKGISGCHKKMGFQTTDIHRPKWLLDPPLFLNISTKFQ
jgi:hypothetical protein